MIYNDEFEPRDRACLNEARILSRTRPYYAAGYLKHIIETSDNDELVGEAAAVLLQVINTLVGQEVATYENMLKLDIEGFGLLSPLVRIKLIPPQKNPKLEQLRLACCSFRLGFQDWVLVLDLARTAAMSLRMEAKTAYYIYGEGDDYVHLMLLCDMVLREAWGHLDPNPKSLFEHLDH